MPSAQPGPAVLLVDDTPSIRQFLLHALDRIVPWELVAVPDATAALAVLAARPVPLLIADYHLNDMRGDELAAEAKAASPATKVLLISADVGLDGDSPPPHVDGCLIKPFTLGALQAKVRELIPVGM